MVKLVQYPDPILTTPTERIVDFSEVPVIQLKLRTAIRLNVDKDGNYNLVGLAANQIGISKSVCVCLVENHGKKEWITMVNPKITDVSLETETDVEGCGSLREPVEQYFEVERPIRVSVIFSDIHGHKMGMNLTGFDARVVQHEVDHLNGIMISDRGTPVEEER